MIEIINLHKSFNAKQVLCGVNLHIERGETMVVIGGSGSGKSVLIKHIIGLLIPDEGSVTINGVDIFDLSEGELNNTRKKFGMLFQGAALFDSLTVWENVGFALKQHTDYSKEEIRDIAARKLEMVGLRGIEDLMPSELSGGVRKRGDRIAMLYEGRIHGVGTPDEIKLSQDPVIRQFITGSSVGPIKAV